MAKPLVIVESPAKAKKIGGYLGSNYTVMASMGHVRDLPESAKDVPEEIKNRLRDVAPSLDPLRLLEEIRRMQRHLAELAAGETQACSPGEIRNWRAF